MPDLEIPTPSPLPSPSDTPHTLSDQINIATRSVHSQLNRLILVRLPLSLPPHTTNPSTYVSGLLHIAPIYITFETLWHTILDSPCLPTTIATGAPFDACEPGQPLLDSKSIPLLTNTNLPPLVHTPKVCSRTHSMLQHLLLPGLLRAGRLRADIRILTGTPEHKIDEQLEAVSRNGRLQEFIAHTKKSVDANPHVLLAYAWVLYMALFSGGRYLRASLKEAGGVGPRFWDREPSPVRPYAVTGEKSRRRGSRSDNTETTLRPSARSRSRSESGTTKMVPGMQFFNFIGDEDGEDIKIEFKKRVSETEKLLTTGEKEDIITEAQHIFSFMVLMVHELDAVMDTKEDILEQNRMLQTPRPLVESRDSVAATRERLTRKAESEEKPGLKRKPSFLEVLFTVPVTKFVRFQGKLPSWDIVRRFSKESSSQVTFKPEPEDKATELDTVFPGGITMMLSSIAFVVVLLACYYGL